MASFEQITPKPLLYVNNLQISNNATTPNTKIDVAAGAARDSGNDYDIELASAVTINADVNGANGLDTGSLGNATWYAVHVIGDSSNKNDGAALLSTSRTAPVLPSGYDVFRHIGWALTDGSAHFLLFNAYGNGNLRKYFWDAVVTELNAQGNTSFTDVDLASSVPPTSTLVYLNWKLVPQAAGNLSNLRKNGSSSTTNVQLTGSVAAQPNAGQLIMNTDSAQVIEYKTAHADDDLTLIVTGFEDFI
jgi:hypothetical protein